MLRHSVNETCACQHLTVFQLKKDTFIPSINILTEAHTEYDLNTVANHILLEIFCTSSFTWSNITKHPTVFLVNDDANYFNFSNL